MLCSSSSDVRAGVSAGSPVQLDGVPRSASFTTPGAAARRRVGLEKRKCIIIILYTYRLLISDADQSSKEPPQRLQALCQKTFCEPRCCRQARALPTLVGRNQVIVVWFSFRAGERSDLAESFMSAEQERENEHFKYVAAVAMPFSI